MDGIHDMGGMQDFGAVHPPDPAEVPFPEEWEKRAFAIALLSMRLSGTNLDAFRHSMNRLTPLDYLADGYYGRWLRGAENLLTDSGIIAEGAVDARTRKMLGEDVTEPQAPEPHKPDYKPAGPGSLRPLDTAPRFSPGDRVRAKDIHPSGHTRLPRYVRGRTGSVRRVQPAQVLPAPGGPQGQLYNLKDDPGQTKNLWLTQPDQVRRLSALLEKAKKDGRTRK